MSINIVCKQYINDFLKTFSILICSMSILLSIVGLIEKIDDFMPYKPHAVFLLTIRYTLSQDIFLSYSFCYTYNLSIYIFNRC